MICGIRAQSAALAVAELIAGKFSPSGRLPITFYGEHNTIPDFTDYNMSGRTYRYITEKPLYPFGYGLSYTKFEYSDVKVAEAEDGYEVSVKVKNTGKMHGVEKVQVYAEFKDSRTPTPNFQLCGLYAVELDAGEEREIKLHVDAYWTKAVLADGRETRLTADSSST